MRILVDDASMLDDLEETLGLEKLASDPVAEVITVETLADRLPEYEIVLPDLSELATLPDFEEDLLPNWLPADVLVMLRVGILGALISSSLYTKFDKLHRKWGGRTYDKGGHSGECIDKDRGLTHRFKRGHDILNPFEVDWDNYLTDGSQASFLKKMTLWLRHLAQDSFSREGLPLPGSSYIGNLIAEISGGPDRELKVLNYNQYKVFGTLKARDFVGMTAVPLLIKAYVFGTEFHNKKRFLNYRYLSLTLGALVSALTFGFMTPKPSLNYPALTVAIRYAIALWRLDRRLGKLLKERQRILDSNAGLVVADSSSLLLAADAQLEADSRLTAFWAELSSIHDMTSSAIEGLMDDIENTLRSDDVDISALESLLSVGGV